MFKQVFAAVGLWWGATARAAVPLAIGTFDPGSPPPPEPAPLAAGPVEEVKEKVEEAKSQKQLEQEARQREIDEANAQKAARVIVLPWQGEDFWQNENLRANVSIRIARPDAKFYPDIDLYQAGRKEQDRSVRPGDQRAIVPESAISEINSAVGDVSTIPYNALPEQDWALKAHELRDVAEKMWFVDRPELREPLFQLYVQIGRAAENSNSGSPPFYDAIGGVTVNYYWYLAGSMAWETPELLAKIPDQELNASVSNYRTMLETGQIPLLKLDFTLESEDGRFDPSAFANDYQVFMNGVEKTITSDKGLLEWPPGRVDVYLKRDDGHSMSDRIEISKFQEKVYFVRGVARKKMGLDFAAQLLENPNDCMPNIDGDVVNYLSIYQKLHPLAQIYIAIPYAGSTASNKIMLWRWDPAKGGLVRVEDNTGGFPIRFALIGGTGVTFAGARYLPPTEDQLTQVATSGASVGATDPLFVAGALDNFSLNAAGIPFNVQLRGHYGRLMIPVGLQYTLGVQKDNSPGANGPDGYDDMKWRDSFQAWNKGEEDYIHYNMLACDTVTTPTGTGTDAATTTQLQCSQVLRARMFQRLAYTGVGVVLGRKASIGYGYRGWIRTGWYNAPHAVDITGHLGLAANPLLKKPDGRANPVLDLDFWGGGIVPFRDSVYVAPGKKTGPFQPLFGFQALVGSTF